LQAKYHKADGSECSLQSENGNVKAATSSHKQHSRNASAQPSQDDSNSSTKDHEDDLDDIKLGKQKRSSNRGSNKDLPHTGDTDKLTVGKSRARHKSFNVERSKTTSGPSSTVDLETAAKSQPRDAENTAGLLSVSKAGMMVSRSNQDLSGNYLRFSPRPSSSHRSSHIDVTAFSVASQHRTISASNSVGSGLDDDEYIDPHRDVGIAVCIRDGYFSWLPQANGEAMMRDINFIADAGQFGGEGLFYFS